MPLHWRAWNAVMSRHGIHFSEERFYAMGGVPSRDILKLLRQEQGLADVVLVALTGYGQDSDRQQALDAGFDHHLVKPVSLEALHELLGAINPGLPATASSFRGKRT